MRFNFIYAFIAAALGVAACGPARAPVVLNNFSGPEKADSEVAVVRSGNPHLTAIDGQPIPPHPEPEKFYYRDIRLPPGQHTLAVTWHFSVSILVDPAMFKTAARVFSVNLEPGHLYELHADRTHGGGYRVYLWVEDKTNSKVIAGQKLGGTFILDSPAPAPPTAPRAGS